MNIKWIGALLVIFACGGFGIKMACFQIKEEQTLRRLIGLLDFMSCELQYHLTPLPELCRQTAAECSGVLSEFFMQLGRELDDQIKPNVQKCVYAALTKTKRIPQQTRSCLELLGRSLGKFDLEGQLKGIEAARQNSRRKLEVLEKNRDVRLRGYQTLALCAGAALVILFM